MQKRICGKVSFRYIYILHCPIMMIATEAVTVWMYGETAIKGLGR